MKIQKDVSVVNISMCEKLNCIFVNTKTQRHKGTKFLYVNRGLYRGWENSVLYVATAKWFYPYVNSNL
jgi:hypothetical protein